MFYVPNSILIYRCYIILNFDFFTKKKKVPPIYIIIIVGVSARISGILQFNSISIRMIKKKLVNEKERGKERIYFFGNNCKFACC